MIKVPSHLTPLGDFIPSIDVSPLCLHLFTASSAENHSSTPLTESA